MRRGQTPNHYSASPRADAPGRITPDPVGPSALPGLVRFAHDAPGRIRTSEVLRQRIAQLRKSTKVVDGHLSPPRLTASLPAR